MANEVQVEQILSELWNKNPIFRDNLSFLSNVSLRNLPSQILPEFLARAEDNFKYIPPPPVYLCIS